MRHYGECLTVKLVSLLFAELPLVSRFTGSLERRDALAHSFDHVDFFAIRTTGNFQTCLRLARKNVGHVRIGFARLGHIFHIYKILGINSSPSAK